jgi:AcrR family transcriptional regulator
MGKASGESTARTDGRGSSRRGAGPVPVADSVQRGGSSGAAGGRSANRRDAVLDAASRIVERDGAAHLTIDAVAAEARLSKGGVLYHFPSKSALLAGMLDRLLADFDQRTAALEASEGSLLRAWIRAEHEQSPSERALSLALLANAAEDPALLAPAREFVRESFDRLRAAGPDGDLNLVLALAVEGLRFLGMVGLLVLEPEELRVVNDRLVRLAQEAGS